VATCDADEIVKGYKAGDGYIEITGDDLDALEVESSRTINVDQFVPRAEIADLYVVKKGSALISKASAPSQMADANALSTSL
jgi:non-homologous end joining protein Ku